MSRLSDLIDQLNRENPRLGADLQAELSSHNQRTFGLVFERHLPESVELPGRPVRRGDSVNVLPPRGSKDTPDTRLWRVDSLRKDNELGRVARLIELHPKQDTDPELRENVPADDLVVVAQHNDTIYPGLVQTGEVIGSEDPGAPFHSVINAENYHALRMLTYTHYHSIDCIYIDPPYNTGKDDWIYSDRYVDADDVFRHSKWLAFMERRLRVARNLLSPTGIIIVAIGNEQQHRLRMLMDDVFGESNFISNVTWNGGRKNDSRFVSNGEDYMLIYANDKAAWIKEGVKVKDAPDVSSLETAADIAAKGARWRAPKGGYEAVLEKGAEVWREARLTAVEQQFGSDSAEFSRLASAGDDTDFDTMYASINEVLPADDQKQLFRRAELDGEQRMRAFYRQFPTDDPVRKTFGRYNYFLPDGTLCRDDNITWPGGGGPAYDVLHPETGKAVPVPDRGWRFSTPERMQEDIEAGRVIFRKDHTKPASLKQPLEQTSGIVRLSAFDRQRTHGSRHLHWNNKGEVRGVFAENRFPNPKDVTVLADWIEVCTPRDGVVLDFFGGSGSTLEAVMLINERSQSRRSAIVVTNNEVGSKKAAALAKQGIRKGDPDWEQWGVCEYVTKPRVKTVVTGKREDGSRFSDGFEANARFFTLTYQPPTRVRYGYAFAEISPLLWLRAGQTGRIIESIPECGWDIAESYAIIENVAASAAFSKELSKHNGIKVIYIVTNDDLVFESMARELADHDAELVRLYSTYLNNFAFQQSRETV